MKVADRRCVENANLNLFSWGFQLRTIDDSIKLGAHTASDSIKNGMQQARAMDRFSEWSALNTVMRS